MALIENASTDPDKFVATAAYACGVCEKQCYPVGSTIVSGVMYHNMCLVEASRNGAFPSYTTDKIGPKKELKIAATLPVTVWMEIAKREKALNTHISAALARDGIKIAFCQHCKQPRDYKTMVVGGVTKQLMLIVVAAVSEKSAVQINQKGDVTINRPKEKGAGKAHSVPVFCNHKCDIEFARLRKADALKIPFDGIKKAIAQLESVRGVI